MQEPSLRVKGIYQPHLVHACSVNFYWTLFILKLISDDVFAFAKRKLFERYLW